VQQVLAQVGFAEAFVQYPSVQDALAAYEAQEYLQLQGHTLRGRYQIQKNLYVGQKAAVFKAFDTWFERPVTIKVVPQSAGRQARQMLLREARAVARMNHPNIASVHDCLEHGDRLFLIREYVDGRTLREHLSELEAGQLLPPEQVLTIGRDILGALAYAHQEGVVHHYLQPKNVMIAGQRSKVINFGLVETSDEEWSLNDVSYMAPEQLAHKASTESVDLYALGAIVYELVTGRPPFLADSVEQLIQLCLQGQIAPPRSLNPRIPASLEEIIVRLLERDPAQRYASAKEVLADLRQVAPWDA
jgi:serine/threonine-protein kinase